jgi:hypothetical protein
MPSKNKSCANPGFFTDENGKVRGPICKGKKKSKKADNKHVPTFQTGKHEFHAEEKGDTMASKFRNDLTKARKLRNKPKKKINWREE